MLSIGEEILRFKIKINYTEPFFNNGLINIYLFQVEYYHNNRVDDCDRGTAVTTTMPTTQCVYENNSSTPSAIIIQPAHLPYQIAQPGAQPAGHVTVMQPGKQPTQFGVVGPPPPYEATTSYPNEQKVGL